MNTKGNFRNRKAKRKAKVKSLLVLLCFIILATTVATKGNNRKVVGYIYDSGSTVWEMASRHCPYGMDTQEFAREIEKANGIKKSVVYKNWSYKIPVYETENKYLDMTTITDYELLEDGLLLLSNDGNEYLIKK